MTPHQVELVTVGLLTGSIVDVRLRLLEPRTFSFEAGQHVTLALRGGAFGTYSIASPPSDSGSLRFLVRTSPTRPSALLSMVPGTSLELLGPSGVFVLDKTHPGDIVFCATGVGISPILAMLYELALRPPLEKRRLFWGVRSEEDLAALPEVQHLCRAACTSLSVHVSRPSDSWKGAPGRITDAVLQEIARYEAPTVYLVGVPAMVSELQQRLDARIECKVEGTTRAARPTRAGAAPQNPS